MVARRTHEQYVEDVAQKNPNIEVLETYVNIQTKILHMCKICGHKWLVIPNAVLRGSGCPMCNNLMKKKTHEQYASEIAITNPTIDVVGEYVDAKTKILHKCKICGYKWEAIPYNILGNKSKCPVCQHKCIGNFPEYKNSIWASDHKNYFSKYMTEEQMKAYMPNSTKKILIPCPQCKHIKSISPARLLYGGFGCLYCSDGVSYPNKFARALIEQLPVYNVENEYSPEWCVINNNKCRYDVYFEYNNRNYIVEMDGGLGHGFKSYNHNKDDEGLARDKEKDRLAQNHGIIVIRIDSKISDPQYIKNNILTSMLSKLFDLSGIDWEYCDKQATSSNIIEASLLWNNGYSLKSISDKLHVRNVTVSKYLKRGNKLGLCNYSKGDALSRSQKEVGVLRMRKVIRLHDKMVYKCIGDASSDNSISNATIIKYCQTHNGFMYYDEWLSVQDIK